MNWLLTLALTGSVTVKAFTLPACTPWSGPDALPYPYDPCFAPAVTDTTPCVPERNLAVMRLWCAPQWANSASLVRAKRVDGREGMPDTIAVPLEVGIASCFLTLADSAGNVSCPSQQFGANIPPVGIAPFPAPTDTVFALYDVCGRRVDDGGQTPWYSLHLRPGIYFLRSAKRTKRVVIVR
jgi:hypothetical protein